MDRLIYIYTFVFFFFFFWKHFVHLLLVIAIDYWLIMENGKKKDFFRHDNHHRHHHHDPWSNNKSINQSIELENEKNLFSLSQSEHIQNSLFWSHTCMFDDILIIDMFFFSQSRLTSERLTTTKWFFLCVFMFIIVSCTKWTRKQKWKKREHTHTCTNSKISNVQSISRNPKRNKNHRNSVHRTTTTRTETGLFTTP